MRRKSPGVAAADRLDLVLEDGSAYAGRSFGFPGSAAGDPTRKRLKEVLRLSLKYIVS